MPGIGIGNRLGFFSGGPPPILSDGNTVAWFDSALQYIEKDGSDFVSKWLDKSGLNHDLLQAVGTNQPLHTTDGVLFDGIDNIMRCVGFTYEQPEQIYIVFRIVAWNEGDYVFDGDTGASGILSTRGGVEGYTQIYGGAWSGANANSLLPVGTFGILRLLFNGASSSLQVNEATAVTGNFGALDMGGFSLGANPGGANFANIEVKEIILRKIADTSENKGIIYDYLAAKYSI